MTIPRVEIPGTARPVVTPIILRPAVSPLINSLFTVARPTTFKSSKSFGGSDIAVSIVNLVVASNVAIFFNSLALLITSVSYTHLTLPTIYSV